MWNAPIAFCRTALLSSLCWRALRGTSFNVVVFWSPQLTPHTSVRCTGTQLAQLGPISGKQTTFLTAPLWVPPFSHAVKVNNHWKAICTQYAGAVLLYALSSIQPFYSNNRGQTAGWYCFNCMLCHSNLHLGHHSVLWLCSWTSGLAEN